MSLPNHPNAWQLLLDSQEGVVAAGQLRRHGFSRNVTYCRIQAGHWLQVLPGVTATVNGPLTHTMRLHAALVYGGPFALLSHETAEQEWGFARIPVEPEPIHITVPYKCSAVNQPATFRRPTPTIAPRSWTLLHPGVVVHRSRAIAHIRVDTPLPRTSKAATIIDLATMQPTPRRCLIRIVELMTNGRVSIGEVREHLELRAPRRYKKPIADALAMLTGGVQSALEQRYVLDVEQAHGLPSGRRQSPVTVDGRTLYEDVDYSNHGVPLIVRLDGFRFHSARPVRLRDRRRGNAAELAKRPRLEFGWEETVDHSCRTYREVRDVLVREGWSDSSHRCGSAACE